MKETEAGFGVHIYIVQQYIIQYDGFGLFWPENNYTYIPNTLQTHMRYTSNLTYIL